ncbi:MAG: hypothetical protein V7K67_02990 [Nostoc sp.]
MNSSVVLKRKTKANDLAISGVSLARNERHPSNCPPIPRRSQTHYRSAVTAITKFGGDSGDLDRLLTTLG